jgi:heme exporter protein B
MLSDALLVAGKDLRIELRSKVALNQVAPFAVCVLLLFGFALGPDRKSLEPAAPGLFWVAVLLSALLAVHRSVAVEAADDARDGLRLSGLDPGGIFLGKAFAVAAELLVLEIALTIGVAVFYGAHLDGFLVLMGSCVLASVGVAAAGTVYGIAAHGSRVRETLLPLLFLPIVAPVLLAGTKAWQGALAGARGAGAGWLIVLAVFAVVYLAVGIVAFEPLLEDS